MLRVLSVAGLIFLSGCAGSMNVADSLLAPERFPSLVNAERAPEYVIGPLDELTITVFQEPDLSTKDAPVDASGSLLMPLIGSVYAEGKTSSQLALELERLYGERYLVDPQISIIVAKSVGQIVTLNGQVKKPGVFQMDTGRISLLQALALAEGTTEVASTDDIIVFRTEGGKRYAAKFNLASVQSGNTPDPEIRGGDVIIVGTSTMRGLYRDLLQTAPLLGPLFVLLAQ